MGISKTSKNLKRMETAIPAVKTDGWVNTTSGQGVAGYDSKTDTYYQAPVRIGDLTLENLYTYSDLARTIIDKPTDMAMKDGYTLSWDGSDEAEAEDLRLWLESTYTLSDIVTQARKWERLYGGAAILPITGGDVSQPVEVIDGISTLRVLERPYLDAVNYYADFTHPKFEDPMMYRYKVFTVPGQAYDTKSDRHKATIDIHESWLTTLRGIYTTRAQLRRNKGWGESVLQNVYEVLKSFEGGWESVMQVLAKADVSVWKFKNLMGMLASDNADDLFERLRVIQNGMSTYRGVILDSDGEDYSRVPANLDSTASILEKMMARLAHAAGIPVVQLFGISPGGLGSNGEQETRAWYDTISTERDIIRVHIEKLIKILVSQSDSPVQIDAETLCVEFPSLWKMSPAEEAQMYTVTAQADVSYINAGVYEAEEVAIARSSGNTYGPIMIDVAEREALLADSKNAPEPEPFNYMQDPNASQDQTQPEDQSAEAVRNAAPQDNPGNPE